MWVPLMEALAGAGRRSIAPDLYGFGDSTDAGPRPSSATSRPWARCTARSASARSRWWSTTGAVRGARLGLQHPGEVEALVISDTGFFSDGSGTGWPRRSAASRVRRSSAHSIAKASPPCCARWPVMRSTTRTSRPTGSPSRRATVGGRHSTSTARWTSRSSSRTRASSPSSVCRPAALGRRGRVRPGRRRAALRARDPGRGLGRASRAPAISSSTSSRNAAPTRWSPSWPR